MNTNTKPSNEMLKRVQHDKKKCVIPNLFRNLESGNGNISIAFALVAGASFCALVEERKIDYNYLKKGERK